MTKLKDAVVFVAGLGQIGGSIALALKESNSARQIVGFDSDEKVMRRARRLHLVDETVKTLAEGVDRADLIVLSAPISEILRMIPEVGKSMKESAVCIDVASTKAETAKTAARAGMTNFVGGHPIAGNELTGLDGATSDKFKNKTFALTPSKLTSQQALRFATQFVKKLGATPLVLSPEEHDNIMALTSGLPHVIALALSRLAQSGQRKHHSLSKLIGGSFTSATRVASSPEHLIANLLMTNRKAVSKNLSSLIREMQSIKRLLDTSDRATLKKYISSAGNRARGKR